MRFLVRIVPSQGDIEDTTRTLRGTASSMGGKGVNPKRTSYGALEMDFFFPSRPDFDVFLAAIEPFGRLEFANDLQEPQQFLPTPKAVAEAVSLFNAERFWEAHEVFESLWRVAQGDEKKLLQGLILVCAAFVHEQKGERDVALGVAKRALPLLKWDEALYHGVDIGKLNSRVSDDVAASILPVFRI